MPRHVKAPSPKSTPRARAIFVALCGGIALFFLSGSGHAQTAAKATAPSPGATSSPGSIEEAQAQVKKSPKDPAALLALGTAYRRAHRHQEAVDTFKKLIAVDPKGSAAHVSLGAVYMDLNRPNDAEREFQKALSLNPSDAGAHFNMGNFFLTKGRRDDALSEFNKATQAKPPLADAWISVGLIQAELGKQDEAIQAYNQALGVDSLNVRAITNLGNAEYARGRISEATGLYRKGLKIDPKNQETNYNMGVAFADAQMFKVALSYWKYVVAVDSTSTVAESAKGSIQVLEDYLNSLKSRPPANSTTGSTGQH